MMKRYPVPAGPAQCEIKVVNSRFIASIAPAFTVEEAQAFIDEVKACFPDASHHVPVFLIGFGESVTAHSSDAGEPSGTAGRPVLAVLQGSGLGDVVVVVTRYFGGTKLGMGGLVRAYSEAVRTVLGQTRRAERVLCQTVMMELPYNLLERARRLIGAHHGLVLDEDFTDNVVITARFAMEHLPEFQIGLVELTSGAAQIEMMEISEVLMPLED
jgi:uncharacterized YigZ family protein